MRLYFKMRNIEHLGLDEQKAFIKKYVEDYCHLQQCGVETQTFIEHEIEESPLKIRNFMIGSYKVKEDADFARIELKMKLFNVQEHFIVFVLF